MGLYHLRGEGSALGAFKPTREDIPLFVVTAVVVLLVLFPYWGFPVFFGQPNPLFARG
ncbi:MAG: hypothetical protein O2807_00755 [bacterium]|nr:hypothetical protein [bacterium]